MNNLLHTIMIHNYKDDVPKNSHYLTETFLTNVIRAINEAWESDVRWDRTQALSEKCQIHTNVLKVGN